MDMIVVSKVFAAVWSFTMTPLAGTPSASKLFARDSCFDTLAPHKVQIAVPEIPRQEPETSANRKAQARLARH